MHLKKISICGFKSFADRVSLTFGKGITGIVGPNGAGKSNIIDAVRWVMGEQNAKNLRGEIATDIIFTGSERRKPMGMAEVSLSFDNAENSPFCPPEYRHETEIVLTRRIYADGQRDYLINRKPCRLKDIVGFFATTGLGGRSYSMIQQGQVERILNAKPEEIREILEEAAGTLLYKKRKEEAQRKLAETSVNLSRVHDILSEIVLQKESLKEQVEKAKIWQELSDKLREEELSLFANNFMHLKNKHDEILSQLEAETNKEVECLTALAHYEAEAEKLQQVMSESDPELQMLQEKISAIREVIARSESQIKSSHLQIESSIKRLKDIEAEISDDNINLKKFESQVETANQDFQKALDNAARIQGIIDTLKDEVERLDETSQVFRNKFDEFNDEFSNLDRLLQTNKIKKETLEREMVKTKKDMSQLEERITAISEDLTKDEATALTAELRVTNKKQGLDVELKNKHNREIDIAKRYIEQKNAMAQRDAAKEKYLETRAKYTSLQEIAAEGSNIQIAVNNLKSAFESLPVQGLLTDFISFNKNSQELSRPALSSFERWAERLLVSNFEDFNSLVRVANQTGIDTLPVSLLSSAELLDKAEIEKWANNNDAEPFTKFLDISEHISGLDHLLDRLYHLPSIHLSSEIFSSLPKGIIVFTAQGVTFAGQEDLFVGTRKTTGLLSRKKELENLAAVLKSAEKALGKHQAEVDRLDALQSEDRQVIAELSAKMDSQNKDVLALMSDLQSATQQVSHKNDLLTAAKQNLNELSALYLAYQEEIEDLDKNHASLEEEKLNLRAEFDAIKEESAQYEEKREEVIRQYQDQKIEVAKAENQAQNTKKHHEQAKSHLELVYNKLSKRYEERLTLEQNIEQARVGLEQNKKEIERSLIEREQIEGELAKKREQHAQFLEEQKIIEEKLKECRQHQNTLQKILSDKNISLEKVKMAIANIVEQAKEKYKIEEMSDVEVTLEEDFNPESKTRSVQRLKAKIEAIGPINMMAIKEYEHLLEREKFIQSQRDEITASIDVLNEAIQEMEETSKEKFFETFHAVSREFTGLFPILFPGGAAHLELIDNENPLLTGVEILCSLPGKKQQRMNLFSGGEKALTAISLIFALLKTKPTPFCFLDEVDAPLDEANVGRYNRVLETLSKQFQFITITHNRLTMEVLDTLYGITMQEPGVSTVVGVDMTKDLPPHLQKAFTPPPRAIEGASANANT